MAASAKLLNARISAQKARLVVDQIRGKSVEVALDILSFSTKRAAVMVKKVLKSAIANADHNFNMDIGSLSVSRAFVNEAASLKRFHARAKGRGDRIVKRNSHIVIEVA